MKKVFFALAVVAMFSFVACNGNAAATASNAADTTVAPAVNEPAPVEANADTTAVNDMAEDTEAATEEVNQ